jgi:uncharacterized membrane protein
MSQLIEANKLLGIVRSVSIAVIFIVYPYLIYQGRESGLIWLAPVIFSGIYIHQALIATNKQTRILKLIIAASLLVGAVFLQAVTAKLLPVVIQLLLMFFFGRTLYKGPPLIESFVRLEFPEFPQGISDYCRQLTIVWTSFFGFNALMCAGLAMWAPAAWWAFYNSILIFVMIGILMVGEYIYRHFRFPDLDIPKPASTIKTMLSNGRKIWLEVQAR